MSKACSLLILTLSLLLMPLTSRTQAAPVIDGMVNPVGEGWNLLTEDRNALPFNDGSGQVFASDMVADHSSFQWFDGITFFNLYR